MTTYSMAAHGVTRDDGANIPECLDNRDWQEFVRWTQAGGVPDPLPPAPDPAVDRTARAWDSARALIEARFDSYSQISATNLRMDPACPAWRAERIGAVMAWISTVWGHYGQVKASIQAGVDTPFDSAIPGECPWTIWQIAASEP